MRLKKRNSKPNLLVKAMFAIAIMKILIKLEIHFEVGNTSYIGNN